MKTGLITFCRPERMESVLRIIAIEKKVEMLGGDCEVISYCPNVQSAQPARKQRGKTPSGASRVGPRVSGHCFSSSSSSCMRKSNSISEITGALST